MHPGNVGDLWLSASNPVHIVRDKITSDLSPSSFIPFCFFSGESTSLGIKNYNFSVSLCDEFKPKVLAGQLCYSFDINSIFVKDKHSQGLGLKNGKKLQIIRWLYNFSI